MGSSVLLVKCATVIGEGRNVCGEMNVQVKDAYYVSINSLYANINRTKNFTH